MANGRNNRNRNGSSSRTVFEEFQRQDDQLERELDEALDDLESVANEPDGEVRAAERTRGKTGRHPQRA